MLYTPAKEDCSVPSAVPGGAGPSDGEEPGATDGDGAITSGSTGAGTTAEAFSGSPCLQLGDGAVAESSDREGEGTHR